MYRPITSLLALFVWASLAVLNTTAAKTPTNESTFSLSLRDRKKSAGGDYVAQTRSENWKATQTAIIVCDMWDSHHCKRAVDRVNELAPRMNRVLEKARAQGALIIHAPSDCMVYYKNSPMRKRAQDAPKADNLPTDIGKWCVRIPAEENGEYPIDQTDGGEDDAPAEHAQWAAHLKEIGRDPRRPWVRQIKTLKMDSKKDFISDSGVEIWNVLEAHGINNVILLGVHTNMCVLGRPFGLRQMAKNGKNVVLMRDMTDTMYNPARRPYVSHFRGTDLIVEHIEKFVCPTITSDQVIGGPPFRFSNDNRPHVVILINEDEYKTDKTLPKFAQATLRDKLGLRVTVLQKDKENIHLIPGAAKAVAEADLLLVSVRRRALPKNVLDAIKKHLDDGKPMVGIRTANHAFDAKGKGPKGHAEWPKFDHDVLGGNYHGHYKAGPVTKVTAGPKSKQHPILENVSTPFSSKGSLYKVAPLAKGTTLLLEGKIEGKKAEPIAWTNQYGKARIFYTSLGYPTDFSNESFVDLLGNAVMWGLEKSTSPADKSGKAPVPQNR